ncbi:hypothetical protein, partial [Neisseria gonorrhoeae]|uniref:hypothetical protein n=1 Tax=Neisseria gonorrhoeae TaxID=485 RepID=UPI0027D98C80
FVLSGAELPPEQQAELAKLQTEGAQLSAKFSQNVLDATDAFGDAGQTLDGVRPAGVRLRFDGGDLSARFGDGGLDGGFDV